MMQSFDLVVFKYFNAWAGIAAFFDWAIIFRATYLWYIVLLAVAGFGASAFVLRWRAARARNIRLAVHAAVSAAAAYYLFTALIRFLYNRPRPFEILPDAVQIIPHAGGGSFPSGHAALAFAVAAAVYFYYPKTSIFFFLAALSIGISRVAAGLHWPSDIAGGAIIGVCTAWLIRRLAEKRHKEEKENR